MATTEFSRPVQLRALGPAQPGAVRSEIAVEAVERELGPLARRLDVPAVLSLRCRFLLSGTDREGRVLADGILECRLVRVCVATLEPFETTVSDAFAIRFVPDLGGLDDVPLDLEADDDVPYAGSAIDLGEAATEQLALALDPYPRRPGAELPPGIGAVDLPPSGADPEDGDAAADPDRPNPFSVLAGRGRGDH